MNASMLLVTTAWIAGADVVPAGCANCSAPAPAPVVVSAPVAAPAADCGCEAGPCASSKHGGPGLFSKLKGMFGSRGGKHHKGGCDGCGEAAPACDSCGGAAPAVSSYGPAAGAPVVGAPAATPPSVMPAPVANPEPKAMPAAPAPAKKDGVQAPKIDGQFAIPQVVTPVSAAPKAPALGSPASPF